MTAMMTRPEVNELDRTRESGVKPEAASAPALLLVSEMYPPAVGGTAVLFENIYSRIAGLDITVLADATKCRGSETQRGAIRLVRTDIDKRCRGVVNLRDLRQHRRLGRQIRAMTRGRATLVHCGRGMPEGIAAMVSRWMGGPPFLCWAHGEEISVANASREYRWVMRRAYRAAAAIIANSRQTAEMLENAGVLRDRLHVIHPAVDPERFHPDVDGSSIRQRFAGPDDALVLSVGRFHRRKGFDLTIEAIGRLKEQTPTVRCVIIGDGDDRPRLESLAREGGVADRVFFEGEVADELLPQYFAACDIFAMPNRVDGSDVEGFGIVFLEAAASGKPTIGGRSGGVPEAMADGQTGALVSGTDASELAEVIRRLACSPEGRRQFGEAGRKRVLERFTWDLAAEKVRQLHAHLGHRLRLG